MIYRVLYIPGGCLGFLPSAVLYEIIQNDLCDIWYSMTRMTMTTRWCPRKWIVDLMCFIEIPWCFFLNGMDVVVVTLESRWTPKPREKTFANIPTVWKFKFMSTFGDLFKNKESPAPRFSIVTLPLLSKKATRDTKMANARGDVPMHQWCALERTVWGMFQSTVVMDSEMILSCFEDRYGQRGRGRFDHSELLCHLLSKLHKSVFDFMKSWYDDLIGPLWMSFLLFVYNSAITCS